MSVIKCSICGGNVNISDDASVGICEYCGNTITLPITVSSEDPEKDNLTSMETVNASSYLKRAFMFLEESDWYSANSYAEKVLDIDPENGEAYLAKAMAALQASNREKLSDKPELSDDANIKKALKYGSEELKNEINGYIETFKKETDNEIEKVITAIKEYQNNSGIESIESQLFAINQKAKALESLYKDYNQLIERIERKEAEIERINTNFQEIQRDISKDIEELKIFATNAETLQKQRSSLA